MKNEFNKATKFIAGQGWREVHAINNELFRFYKPLGYQKDETKLPGSTGEFSKDKISDLEVNTTKVRKTSKKINSNDLIAEYYEDYFKENFIESTRPDCIKSCFKMFEIDFYKKQKVKDIRKVNLCHDKFCINCQNMASQLRYVKYKPKLDELLNDYNIYHVVFTVPNCSDIMLKHTLERMNNCFARFIRFFQLSKKIKGLDFKKYGYAGAIKAFEIVVNEEGFLLDFHPHFHCLFVLDKKFYEKGQYLNKFSFKRSEIKNDRRIKDSKRFFTEFEILLQKMWYCLFNDIKLTKDNIENVDLGYSCYAQRVSSDYKDVFKYSMKGMYDPKSSRFMYSYKTFKTLYEAIHRKKVIQGYGILNKFSFTSEEEIEEQIKIYNETITALRLLEDPQKIYSGLKELVADMESKGFTYISKKSVLGKKYREYEV